MPTKTVDDVLGEVLAGEHRESDQAQETSAERDRLMRALADAENTRRMAERRVQDARQYAIADFARELLQVADLELDLLRRRVTRAGKRIDLTAKEFGLLELLMRRHGEVLPRSLIASQVWDMNFDSDSNVIEVAVRRLRVKIDEGYDVKLIHTVRGMGYVLEAPEEC